ncbi:MAG TPA: DUF6073 family protein [Blastocatellia bacterium]|nr:DUF6073 family protein [Blastocatellia bacterium]
MATTVNNYKLAYGPRVDLEKLENLYAPQTVEPFTPPTPGIDNLGIVSKDTFYVPGKGEFQVDFKGYVRVARSQPSSEKWVDSTVYTNLIEMCMRGESPELGPITVTLQEEILSTGLLRTPHADLGCDQPEKACRMAVAAQFSLPKLGLTLFNKEPIELTIDHVKAIPPAGAPGNGQIYHVLPLYNTADPEGEPAAYLTRLKFAMGTYITKDEIESIARGN